jgi:hypothetical protein
MTQDPDINVQPNAAPSVASTKPDKVEVPATTPDSAEQPPFDMKYWLTCLEDSERAEQNWRVRGREVITIYRNESKNPQARAKKSNSGGITFNILYANTEVMLPAIYQNPPKPVVRSRFTSPSSMPPKPGRPSQKAIETAASVMEKALEIVVDDENSHEAIKAAIKDTLLPGRGVCRVRWRPEMAEEVVPPDPLTGAAPTDPATGQPQTREVKVWEEVGDEYVYWEDLLVDPVRSVADMDWIAFRHLFTEKALIEEFQGQPEFDRLVGLGKVGDLLKWTDEGAAKDTVGGGSPIRTADKLGDHVRKAMVWEVWSRRDLKIYWLMRDAGGLLMRTDPDSYQLKGFYCIPAPILAVTTTDSRIPRPFYDLYADLAEDLDITSKRISALTRQIKVRGGYNSASPDIASLLTADDQKMIPIDGVDMLNGGLANHIWFVPIVEWVNALRELYGAREQIKQVIYEVMGISDIMRGATKASETATAQRIKGNMGIVRLQDQKTMASNFVVDLLRLKTEIIAQNFDAETLSAMTGEDVTPEVMAILRSDFMRTCSVDIETDSTIVADEQDEQEANAMIMQAMQGVMGGAAQLLQTQLLPPPQVMMMALEMIKMFLQPIKNSRGVVELIDTFMEQLTQQLAAEQAAPPQPQPGQENPAMATGGAPPPEGQPNGAGPPIALQ